MKSRSSTPQMAKAKALDRDVRSNRDNVAPAKPCDDAADNADHHAHLERSAELVEQVGNNDDPPHGLVRDGGELARELHELGVALPNLAGEYFVATGSDKYMRNVALDPEANIGICELDEKGERWRVVWGLPGGGVPTSEFPTHLMNHSVRKRVTGGAGATAASGPARPAATVPARPSKLRLNCSAREGRKPSTCGSSQQRPLRAAIKSQYFRRTPGRTRRPPRRATLADKWRLRVSYHAPREKSESR